MYTSTPPRLPDPPRFFESLAPRLRNYKSSPQKGFTTSGELPMVYDYNFLPVYRKQYPSVTVETRVNIESHHYVENGIQETCMSHQFGTQSVISRVHTFQLVFVETGLF